MKKLRSLVVGELFDYQTLTSLLQEYKKPRDKITQLLKGGEIIRLKKGLYIFGQEWRRAPLSLDLFANLIYGPSYLSKEAALASYGLIPERVYVTTSVTTGKKKSFETPLGLFSYEHLSLERYLPGMRLIEGEGGSTLKASPEKALADLLHFSPRIGTREEMREHLFTNLRIEAKALKSFKKRVLKEIERAYQSRNVTLLLEAIESLS